MHRVKTAVVLLAIGWCGVGLADDQSATPAAAVAAPPPVTAATAAAAPAAPTAEHPTPPGDISSTTVLTAATPPPPADFKPPAGYKAVKKGLTTVYCKSYTPIGSRMPEQICVSEEQLKAQMKQAELDRSLMRQKATAGGTNGG